MRIKNRFRILWLLGLALSFFNKEGVAQVWNPNHKIGTLNGVYNFNYNQTPSQIVELFSATASGNTSGLSYQWQQSFTAINNFTDISGATQSSLSFSFPLSQTFYYRRKTSYSNGQFIYSNIVKLTLVSINWEDINYIREHDVNTTNIATWTAVDQLAIGSKLQTTNYMDGLGRSVQQVSRETATPAGNPNNLWGDMVQFSQFDAFRIKI